MHFKSFKSKLESGLASGFESRFAPLTILFLLSLLHSGIFFPYFNEKNMGHDYALFLPQLLNGVMHAIQNGVFSIPWFSPAMCGGVPFFPDLNNIYFSVPQFFTFLVSPVTALKCTFFVFSLLGGVGFFRLLNRGFKLSPEAALLGSAIFMFNSLFAARMMIGHLTFHSFMLLPWGIEALLPNRDESLRQGSQRVVIASLVFSYMFYSGNVNVLIPVAIIVMAFIAVKMLLDNEKFPYLQLIGSALLTFSLCFAKLHASLHLMQNFPRDFYRLPGWQSLYQVLSNLSLMLFGHLSSERAAIGYTNNQFRLGEHELEFSVGVIPLFLMCACLLNGATILQNLKARHTHQKGMILMPGLIAALIGGVILVVPIAFNVFSPSWHSFLKSIPLIKSTSLMIRWFIIYIPLVIFIGVWGLDHMKLSRKARRVWMTAGMLVVLLQTISWDKSYYAQQPFNGEAIQLGWKHLKQNKDVIPIQSVVAKAGGNLTLLAGESNLACYQPFFGYRLEQFPRKGISPGRVDQIHAGTFNFKNPACYVFPKANSCQIGDHFKANEKDKLISLVNYRNFAFQMPTTQKVANVISFLTMLASLTLLLLMWRSMVTGQRKT